MKAVTWFDQPEEHDYPAAASYLTLIIADPSKAIQALRDAPIMHFKAKDIIRASKLPMLTVENRHVAKNLNKITVGKALSPVLLVRGHDGTLIIADGYHRCCAVYLHDEDAEVPCKIV